MAGPLVSTDWLAEHLGDPGLVVLDGSWHMPADGRDAKAEYVAGHIPGAVFFDIDAIADHASGLPHMLPSPPAFATAVRRLGVEPDSTVVAYDTVGVFTAPRVWWEFRAMGHQAVFVLVGDSTGIESCANGGKMFLGAFVERIPDPGQLGDDGLVFGMLAIEHAQRVGLCAALAILAHA